MAGVAREKRKSNPDRTGSKLRLIAVAPSSYYLHQLASESFFKETEDIV